MFTLSKAPPTKNPFYERSAKNSFDKDYYSVFGDNGYRDKLPADLTRIGLSQRDVWGDF